MKKTHPVLWLLLIPAQLIIDILLIAGASWLDLKINGSDASGHGFPVIAVIAFLVLGVITAVVIILSIILMIKGIRAKKK